MKGKLKNLDVDFIGEQPQQPMTKEEALAISDFIRAYKEKRSLQLSKKARKKSMK